MKTIFPILCVYLLLLCACSNAPTLSSPVGVDMYSAGTAVTSSATVSEIEIQFVPDATIDSTENCVNETACAREKVFGIVLGPGLYRVGAHLSALQALEKQRVNIHVVSGEGFGAILATFFAAGYTSAKMEWIFHRFFNEAKDLQPYSKKWMKLAQKNFIDVWNGKRVENLEKLLLLPYFHNSEEIFWTARGNLKEILEFHLNFLNVNNETVSLANRKNFVLYDKNFFNRKGVDVLIGMDVLGEPYGVILREQKWDQFWKEIAVRQLEQIAHSDYVIRLPGHLMPIDSLEGMAECLLRSHEQAFVGAKEIYEKWARHRDE